MRCWIGLVALAAWGSQAPAVRDFTRFSQVMGANRSFTALLPPSYAGTQKRYPVVYWFGGSSAREVSGWVAAHEVIVIHAGAVETVGQFPLYFPELVEQADQALRTLGDRDHRAVTGSGEGGFMALWVAGKYPDLVASASSLMGATEASVGPRGFDTGYLLDDYYANYDGVRTMLATETPDPLRFYHQRLNATWSYALPHHETQSFDGDAPAVAAVLDFHRRAFAEPLLKPAVFRHADVYPSFAVWGWEVSSDRRQPGVTVLDNVSAAGFRSVVREWMPGGAEIPGVKLSIASGRLYAPGSTHSVTYIRLKDGKLRHAVQKADARGRLNFDLTGEAYEVGVSAGAAAITVSGYDITDAAWATAGAPVKLHVRFLNKGTARSAVQTIRWESPNPGVHLDPPTSRLFVLLPGESLAVPVTVRVEDGARAVVKIVAVVGTNRMPVEAPLFPPAEPVEDFQIADGRTVTLYQHATERSEATLGEGNADGFAAPGESFAVLLPDAGGGLRAAEVFTNDPCVDNSMRASDSWDAYDHAGASVKYSLSVIRPQCEPGRPVHMLLRVVIPSAPDNRVEYRAVEFPIWWRTR